MTCSFSVPYQGTPEDMFPVARQAILKQGGSVSGTSRGGSAAMPTPMGDVAVDYTLQPGTLNITVTHKPYLVSCSMIEDAFRKAIASAPVPRARTPAPPVVIDVAPEPAPHPRGKVVEIPTTYIEGRVPKPTPAPSPTQQTSLVPYVVVGGAALALAAWLLSRPSPRRVRYARA